MMSNTEELQYGKCCCCLEKGDHREMTKQYYLDKRPEIYEVLFKNTFNIVLKYPDTKLICDTCIVELRQATHFKFMVESIQQRLSDSVNWPPEIDNFREDSLKLELKTESIKCESDCHMEEVNNDVQQSTCKEVHYDAEEIDIKEENLVVEEPSQQMNTGFTIYESDDDMEDVPIADHLDIQVQLDPSTSSSDKLAITRDNMNTLKVLVTCDPTVEQLLSYDSNKQLAVPGSNPCDCKRYFCSFCPYKTGNKGHLNEHLRTHTGEKPFTCDICQFKSATKSNLTNHMRIHIRKKLFYCHYCQFKSVIKENVTLHMRTHIKHNQYSCDICDYKTTEEQHLIEHLRIHNRKNSFSCTICDFKSEFKAHLMAHMYTHIEEKLFSCGFCQFQTGHKIVLKSHLLSHIAKTKPIL